jgi:hypothetical protein
VTDREQVRRGPSAAASLSAAGRGIASPHGPRPTPVGTFRTVVGVGPGTGPAARFSPIAPVAGTAPRPVAAQPPRPMHPPIARVKGPTMSPAALQAAAAAARQDAATAPGPRRVVGGPGAALHGAGGRTGFGMPSLRRNICPHFFMTGSRGAMPIQAPHLLKALVRQEANVSRCQLRGGVHLEQGYVNDVCLSARFNQCVFYEDELTR